MKIDINNISVIGLGKLGLPLAVCSAFRNFNVVGIDVNKKTIAAVKNKKAPFFEPRLQELLNKSEKRLHVSTDHSLAISKSDISIVLVPTPSDSYGKFSNKYLKAALTQLGKSLKKSSKPNHIFIVSSTVMPTTINSKIIPLLEKVTGRKVGNGFEVGYAPDFVALGSVVNDFLNPDFVLIGEDRAVIGKTMKKIYSRLTMNNPVISRMSLVSAEITKIAFNNYLTTKISFANMLANICEKLPGSEIDKITETLGYDKRISKNYFKGALAFGGTCFPRDIKALLVLLGSLKLNSSMINGVNQINKYQHKNLSSLVLKTIKKSKPKKISVLGLSFKPNTSVTEASSGIKLLEKLLKNNVKPVIFDPVLGLETRKKYKNKVVFSSSARKCIKGADLVIITTPDVEFSRLKEKDFKNNAQIIDCWRLLTDLKKSKKIRYIGVGEFIPEK